MASSSANPNAAAQSKEAMRKRFFAAISSNSTAPQKSQSQNFSKP